MNWIWQNYCTVFTLNLEPGDVRFCSEFCHLYSLWLWIGILHIFGFSLFICAMKFAQIIFKFLFGYKNFVSDLFTGEQQKKETFKLSVFIMASHRYHFGELLKKLIYYPVLIICGCSPVNDFCQVLQVNYVHQINLGIAKVSHKGAPRDANFHLSDLNPFWILK